MRLSEAAQIVGGHHMGDDVAFSAVSTDTRQINSGDLFVALKGPNFDGNEFALRSMSAGACGVIVEREFAAQVPAVVVNDSLQALQKLSSEWRLRCDAVIAGVTGSNGKTTVKEMLASILTGAGKTLKTQGNLNNHIGVPLTLLRLQDERYAVIEMGANHPGEISQLAKLANVDVAIVTNCADAHLEGFGSREGVAHAKGELFETLKPTGTAIINFDDPFNALWRELAGGRRVIGFGFDLKADVRADLNADGTWQMKTPAGSFVLNLPLPGRHNVQNALAATAAAVAMEIDLAVISEGLTSVSQVGGRLRFEDGLQGSRVIDDTYNANFASFAAAIDVLINQPGKHWLVMGDMAELGADSARLHSDLGQLARREGIERLYACGPLSRHAAEAFGDGARHYENQNSMLGDLTSDLTESVTVLVKGPAVCKWSG